MSIVVELYAPYEKPQILHFDTLDKAVAWVIDNPRMYEDTLDYVQIYPENRGYDVPALVKAAKKARQA